MNTVKVFHEGVFSIGENGPESKSKSGLAAS